MAFSELILGLGLFFLGMQLVGEYLRRLSGPGFRHLVANSTHSRPLAAGLGVLFGGLMQSATAVTFILVSMLRSGLINLSHAAPVVLWCNVGLTALAFVLSFDIHPLVAWLVGLAGIGVGLFKRPAWRATAGVFLGVGLILFGLADMSAGAAPLKNTAWFQDFIRLMAAAPLLAFAGGILAAVLLQSNTGATLLLITLASVGAIDFEVAVMMIYGTNLGAIVLRLFLSAGMHGDSLRLVRLEDLFCVAGGAIMVLLYYLEAAGVPLVAALARAFSGNISSQLAVVFLLSNLLPALVVTVLQSRVLRLLHHAIRDVPPSPGDPRYLSSTALDDSTTSLDLLRKEMAHLIELVQTTEPGQADQDGDEESETPFSRLAAKIEQFSAQLAGKNLISDDGARQLHLLRAELSLARYLESAVTSYRSQARSLPAEVPRPDEMNRLLDGLLHQAVECSAHPGVENLGALSEGAAKHISPASNARRAFVLSNAKVSPDAKLSAENMADDFELCLWILRRLSKLLADSAGLPKPAKHHAVPSGGGTATAD